MKIIRTGRAPSELQYTHTCHNCQTQFTFTLGEVKQEADHREMDTWWACYCPHPPCSSRQFIRKLTPYAPSTVDPY